MSFFRSGKNNRSLGSIPQNYLFIKTKKKKKRILLNSFYLLLVFLAVGAILYALLFLEYFQVKNVSFTGMVTVHEEDIKNVSFDYLGQKGYFLDNNNIFALSSSDLSEKIKKSFRRVKKVEVRKDLPNSLEISVEEYEPVGISCKDSLGNDDPEEFKKADCFYFDKDGVIFDSTPLIVGDLFVSLYDDNIEVNDFPEDHYKKESIDFILKLKDGISKKTGIQVDHFKFLNEYDDVEVVSKSGFKMFFTQEQDPIFQADAVKNVIENKIKDDLVNLDYIDLRIQNRAYYKLKTIDDEASAQEATTTEEIINNESENTAQ